MKMLSKMTKGTVNVSAPNSTLRLLPMYDRIISNSYAAAGGGQSAVGGVADITIDLGTLIAIPLVLGRDMTPNLIAISRSNTTSGSIRLGIYGSDANDNPSTRLFAGEVAMSTTTGIKSVVVSGVTLYARTLYWLAFLASVNVTFKCIAGGRYMGTSWTGSSWLDFQTASKAQTYASGLPDPFGTYDALWLAAYPFIGVRQP